MVVGTLEEIIDDDHAIISTASGPEFYVSIMTFVDKDLLEPGPCHSPPQALFHHRSFYQPSQTLFQWSTWNVG